MTAVTTERPAEGHLGHGHDPATAPPPAAAPAAPGRRRVRALDAVRGLAIVVMLLCVNPGPRDGLPAQLQHAHWHGITFADLFFPLFLFAMGAAMPLSATSTNARTVARRVALLVLLGVALGTFSHGELWLPGVLQHLALAYLVTWLVLKAPRRLQLPICGVALAVYGAAFLVANPDAPWGQADTFAHLANEPLLGGFRTEGVPQSMISFVNVMGGVVMSRWLLEHDDHRRAPQVAASWAVGLLVLGAAVMVAVPANKYLWTPSFALVTTATSFAWFAIAYWLIDGKGLHRPAQPLIVLGSNAIAVYVVFMLARAWLMDNRGFLDGITGTGSTVVSMGWAVAWTLLGWAFCEVLYRRRIFVKV